MQLKNALLAAAGALALSGCLVSVTDTGRPPLSAMPMAPPLAHGPIHNDTPRASFSTAGLGTLDAVMKQYITDGKLGGAVVMIQQDGREVFSEAYGWRDREAGVAMQEDTIFRIASQTKALTSVSIMMLMEEGKHVLEDPVGQFLAEWQKRPDGVSKK